MRFYNIKDDYITFLRGFDTKVAENKHEARPYVGVVLEINGVHYYAPFTSPKPKHQKMKTVKISVRLIRAYMEQSILTI